MSSQNQKSLILKQPTILVSQEHSGPEDDRSGGSILVEPQTTTKPPKLYKVVLLNDDYTPMDFVILVLKKFFNKNEHQASQIMLDVHKKGAGIAGVYPLEIAEMRSMQCNQFARMNQHPLKSTLEPE
jgi:ATP-dependent Clp protease adaptor protein ClpS